MAEPLGGLSHAEAYAKATAHLQAGELEPAERLVRAILADFPAHPDALHLMGAVRFRQGRPAEAATLIERAIANGADSPDHHFNLCQAYAGIEQEAAALAAVERAVGRYPGDARLRVAAARHHFRSLNLAGTIAEAERAVALDPDSVLGHCALAAAFLVQGQFERGWDEYEWRLKLPNGQVMPESGRPQWDGEPLPDQTLLLVADQGFGDGIQFCRYIPWAAERCGRVVVAAGREIRPILEQQPGVALIFDHWQDCPSFAAYAPLSGLPRLHRTRLDTIPAPVPYVQAEPERVAAWARRLDQLLPRGFRRIGLVWAGRPTHDNDRNRSTTLERLAALLELPGIAWVALQKGAGRGQAGRYLGRAPMVNLGPELGDFRDTAAVIEGLERVVTVDTSIAHLAGAMGRPAWVMLPYAPDFRWLLGRGDSPWYPSLRLFRPPEPLAWEAVARDVATALRAAG